MESSSGLNKIRVDVFVQPRNRSRLLLIRVSYFKSQTTPTPTNVGVRRFRKRRQVSKGVALGRGPVRVTMRLLSPVAPPVKIKVAKVRLGVKRDKRKEHKQGAPRTEKVIYLPEGVLKLVHYQSCNSRVSGPKRRPV